MVGGTNISMKEWMCMPLEDEHYSSKGIFRDATSQYIPIKFTSCNPSYDITLLINKYFLGARIISYKC